jgi:hypothetical protein
VSGCESRERNRETDRERERETTGKKKSSSDLLGGGLALLDAADLLHAVLQLLLLLPRSLGLLVQAELRTDKRMSVTEQEQEQEVGETE